MIVIHHFTEEPTSCPYLPDEQSTMEYRIVQGLSGAEYEPCMNVGWRKFGRIMFRPVCETCQACRPLRVLAAEFQPDRSQNRARKRNSDLRVEIGPPRVDRARLALYREYHGAQASRKGWEPDEMTAAEYAVRFLDNELESVEISIWQDDALYAVGLTEITPDAVSAIYHYHDPNRAERSLGTFAILQILDLARRLGKRHVYLGYYVAGCGSLSYKARYRPCEIGTPGGGWERVE